MATHERKPHATDADLVSQTSSSRGQPPGDVNGTAADHSSPLEGPMPPELSQDTLALEQRKQLLRAQFAVTPLPSEELQRQEDMRWARQDPEVLARHRGEFVVPYQRQVVAHGTDAATVRAAAARITGRPPEELPLVGVIDPLLDMPR